MFGEKVVTEFLSKHGLDTALVVDGVFECSPEYAAADEEARELALLGRNQ